MCSSSPQAPGLPNPSRHPLRRAQKSPGARGPLQPPSAPSCCGNPAAITMSLQQAPQSRVFVELVPWADRGRENSLVSGGDTLPDFRRPLPSAQAQNATREVHVSGTAEVSVSPDRAQVTVRINSTKEAAAEVKKSVCRRLDYITQSLQLQGLQVRALPGRSLEPDRRGSEPEAPGAGWRRGTPLSPRYYRHHYLPE